MSAYLGTVVRGVRGPIINTGDDIAKVASEALLQAISAEKINVQEKDIFCITESVVARSQGNYATVDQIAADIKAKFKGDKLGIVFPILSRNRFSIMLKAFARAKKELVILMSYPQDEVGNALFDPKMMYTSQINPYSDVLTESEFVKNFGESCHPFTKMNYVEFYKQICASENCHAEVIFANQAQTILQYTDEVLTCDIHNRVETKNLLLRAGAKVCFGMYEILTAPVNGSGYNESYGLLGSNKSTEEKVKLFPRACQSVVDEIQTIVYEKTGKKIEVMVYGDGAFKDPVGKIWELADPVVSPAYTSGLEGTPSELKLKYLADNDFSNLSAEEQKKAIIERIKKKERSETAGMAGQGTTPRRLTDLLGSLCDLTSGSGDKGTPFIYIQGYFTNYADQ